MWLVLGSAPSELTGKSEKDSLLGKRACVGLRPEDKGLVETIEKWPPEVTSLLRTSELFSTCRSIPQVDCGPIYTIPSLQLFATVSV